MKTINTVILIISIIFISCKKKHENINDTPIFKIRQLISPTSKIKLSKIFQNYHLIPLKTNENCLIGGRRNKIVKHQFCMYILCQCIFLLLLLLSCEQAQKNDKKEIERTTAQMQIISDTLITSMPGNLLIYEHELVWMDARLGEVHVLNKDNGSEIKVLSMMGGSPEEAVTPNICWAPNRKLTVFDVNGAKKIQIALDSLAQDSIIRKKVIPLDKRFQGLALFSLSNGQDIYVTPDSIQPFILASSDTLCPFGNYPLKNLENITNRYSILQGTVAYNPYTGKLLHSIGQLSYMALYKWNDREFVLEKEKEFSEIDYTVTQGRMIIRKTPRYAPTAVAITKDYIVSIERDKETSPSASGKEKGKQSGRPFSNAPHHIFVYDKNLDVVKIIDVNIPIFRIAADYQSNWVYVIGVNPEFCIAAFDIKQT